MATEPNKTAPEHRSEQRHRGAYVRFGLMIMTSTIVMFGLTYVNSYAWDHLRWSETRVYMAVIMGAAMSLVMLSFMHGMYSSRRLNIAIIVTAVGLIGVALTLVRTQATIDDTSYMNAMIPHHPIAILTSEHAQLEDIRVCELAVRISQTQREEISEMSWLVDDIGTHGPATTPTDAVTRAAPQFQGLSERTCR